MQREANEQSSSRTNVMLRVIELLTLRERGVLKRIVGGFSNKEIAAELGVSANTISVHVRNIYKKIHVHSRKEAVSAMASASHGAEKDAAGQVRLTGFSRRGGGTLRHYVLALDQGTTRSCAIVFDKKGNPVSFAQKKVEPTYSRKDWVENDGLAIWSSQAGVAAEAIASAGIHESQIVAVGLANQRATTLVWDRELLALFNIPENILPQIRSSRTTQREGHAGGADAEHGGGTYRAHCTGGYRFSDAGRAQGYGDRCGNSHYRTARGWGGDGERAAHAVPK